MNRIAALIVLFCLDACSGDQENYFPLDEGRWWYYRTTTTILDEPKDQRFVVTNISRGRYQGQTLIVQRRQLGIYYYLVDTADGIERIATRKNLVFDFTADESPVPIFPAKLKLGESWKTPSKLSLVESRTFGNEDKLRLRYLPLDLTLTISDTNASIEINGINYSNCLYIKGAGLRFVRVDRGNNQASIEVTTDDWYAPGIGLIKSTRAETSDSVFLKSGYYQQVLLDTGS